VVCLYLAWLEDLRVVAQAIAKLWLIRLRIDRLELDTLEGFLLSPTFRLLA
jgi:hypothetical protein